MNKESSEWNTALQELIEHFEDFKKSKCQINKLIY